MSRFTGFTDQERGVTGSALNRHRARLEYLIIESTDELAPSKISGAAQTLLLERKLKAQIALKVTKELLAELETGERK